MPAKVAAKTAPKATKPVVSKAAPAKAVAGKTAAVKKVTVKRTRPIRTSAIFRRPHTHREAPKPKYPRAPLGATNTLDAFRIIRYPAQTVAALKSVEEKDTIVFICDPKANKTQIKQAVAKLYQIKATRVNTLIKPDGTKKAFVKLDPSQDTLEVASRIGMLA